MSSFISLPLSLADGADPDRLYHELDGRNGRRNGFLSVSSSTPLASAHSTYLKRSSHPPSAIFILPLNSSSITACIIPPLEFETGKKSPLDFLGTLGVGPRGRRELALGKQEAKPQSEETVRVL